MRDLVRHGVSRRRAGYSITSVARSRIDGGTVTPSALAVSGISRSNRSLPIVITGRRIMHIKSIVAGTVVALVAGVGSVSGNERSVVDPMGDLGSAYVPEQFSTLEGISALPLTAGEMKVVVGASDPFVDAFGLNLGDALVPIFKGFGCARSGECPLMIESFALDHDH